MKYLIPILLIVFVSCGNAEDSKWYKEVDKEICFEAFKKGKVVDKQIKDLSINTAVGIKYILIDIIYKKKYYTLRINKRDSMRINDRNFFRLPSSFKCRVYVETKKIKKKE